MIKKNLYALLITLSLLFILTGCASSTPSKEASSDNDVILYGVSWCPHCQHARQYFKVKGINFKDYDVEESAQYRKEFEKLGGDGYPLIFINGTRIDGFDKEEVEKALHWQWLFTSLLQSRYPTTIIAMPNQTIFQIPKAFVDVQYNAKRIPSVENASDLSLGANCQLYAYELLRHYGKNIPPFRSSNLWEDTEYTQKVDTPKFLDLMLYNKTPDAYGAHIGLYVGNNQILHLSFDIGHPVIQQHNELISQEKYACFIGAKRVLG